MAGRAILGPYDRCLAPAGHLFFFVHDRLLPKRPDEVIADTAQIRCVSAWDEKKPASADAGWSKATRPVATAGCADQITGGGGGVTRLLFRNELLEKASTPTPANWAMWVNSLALSEPLESPSAPW